MSDRRTIAVMVNREERDIWRRHARRLGMPVSTWLRVMARAALKEAGVELPETVDEDDEDDEEEDDHAA